MSFSTLSISQEPFFQFQPIHSLDYEEAKCKLSHLKPESEEHTQLQNALSKTASIAEICLPEGSYKVNTFSKETKLLGGFGSSEHLKIGKEVELGDLGKGGNVTLLEVQGRTSLRFDHIVALAGDFYAIYGQAIVLPLGTDEENSEDRKTERFVASFNRLAEADHNEIRRIVTLIDKEFNSLSNSSTPNHCYCYGMMENQKEIAKIKPDVNDLLIDNSDHFFEDAKEAYRIGHEYAMQTARTAGQSQSLDLLKKAFALDAFACHFLTDLFAAGHIRNQRGALEKFLVKQLNFDKFYAGGLVGGAKLAKRLAGLLTGAQHEQDGKAGLHVVDGNGEEWRAYGDGHFFVKKNLRNSKKAIYATQQSVSEIWDSYKNPDQAITTQVLRLIPKATRLNPPPIYSVEGDSLFLQQGSQKTEITKETNQIKCIYSITEQALKYLPQNYVDSVLSSFDLLTKMVDMGEHSAILQKALIPRIEHFTGSIWQMVGIATYCQVKKDSAQLHSKLDDMSDSLFEIYENTQRTEKALAEVLQAVIDLGLKSNFEEINEKIIKIKDVIYDYKNHNNVIIEDESKMQEMSSTLHKATNRLSRVLDEGNVNNENLLLIYQGILKKQGMSLTKIKIKVTLLFRQWLDHQRDAFALYAHLQALMNLDRNKISKEISNFNGDIQRQMDSQKNESLKDEDPLLFESALIYESQVYIHQKLERAEIIDNAHGLCGKYQLLI